MPRQHRTACANYFWKSYESNADDLLHDWSVYYKQLEAGWGGIYEDRWYGLVCGGTGNQIRGYHRQQESRHHPQTHECICILETKQNTVYEY
jgi:hypothetical protein